MSWRHLKVGGVMIFDDYMWYPSEGKGRPKKPPAIIRAVIRLSGQSWRERLAQRKIAQFAVDCPKPGIDGFLATIVGQTRSVGHQPGAGDRLQQGVIIVRTCPTLSVTSGIRPL